MNAVQEILGGVIIGHFGQSRVHAEKPSIRRGLKDAQNRILENAAVHLFCLLQCLLRQFSLSNVMLDGDEMADGACSRADWRNRHLLGVKASIFLAIDYFPSPDSSGCNCVPPVSYTHLRAHETVLDLVC